MFDKEHLLTFYIDGQWQEPAGEQVLKDIVDPATGGTSGQLSFGSTQDIDRAVHAAHRAFPGYAAWTQTERNTLVDEICSVYTRRMDDFVDAITMEMGAPREYVSRAAQATAGLAHFQAAVQAAREFRFQYRQGSTLIVREPNGVCGLITPWNWPMNQVACKVAPALIAGCSIVLKPSQSAPYSAIVLAEVLHEAGVPPGVFNLVQGDGATLGASLAAHPLVDMISLTGSNAAGEQITRIAAATTKRVSLELGGKSANIILPDADLDAAITHGVLTMMYNSGQTCVAPSRMLVPASKLEAVERIAMNACNTIVVGHPDRDGTTMGPIANERQYRRVISMIETGIGEGAKLIAGGTERPDGCGEGFYLRPTIFSRVRNDMTIAREEIFGPVLVIIPYADESEAIAIANDSPFGLSGYVYGKDTRQAAAVAARLRTGSVHLNGAGVDFQAPWGGYKQSGNGREWGAWGIEEFLETKAILGVDEYAHPG